MEWFNVDTKVNQLNTEDEIGLNWIHSCGRKNSQLHQNKYNRLVHAAATQTLYTQSLFGFLEVVWIIWMQTRLSLLVFLKHWRQMGAVSLERQNPWHFYILGGKHQLIQLSTHLSFTCEAARLKKKIFTKIKLCKSNAKYNMCMHATQSH